MLWGAYDAGLSVRQNSKVAKEWFGKACANGATQESVTFIEN